MKKLGIYSGVKGAKPNMTSAKKTRTMGTTRKPNNRGTSGYGRK